MTQRVRACLEARTQTGPSQPNRKKVQGSMQRIARIRHRYRQHNKEIVAESKRHHVMVEEEHIKCRICAQTRPFDKVTIFADQTIWTVRIQQLKSEMGTEQQERAGDVRSLLGLQANTPRPKEKKEDATPRRQESCRLSVRLKRRRNVKKGLKCAPSCTTEDPRVREREREISTGSWWRRNFSDVSNVGKPRSSTKPRSCSNSAA